MYCISKQHTYVKNYPPFESLIKTDKNGNSTPLIDNDVVLTVLDENKYEITCGNKLLAQGIYDNIFQTVDSLRRFGVPRPDIAVYTHERRRVRRKYDLFEEEIRPITVRVGRLDGEEIEWQATELQRPERQKKDEWQEELG